VNGNPEKLANQLRQFQPADVSSDLRQRIARDLAALDPSEVAPVVEPSRSQSLSPAWLMAATAATVLFVIAMVAGLRLLDRHNRDFAKHSEPGPVEDVERISQRMDFPADGAESSPPPTLLAYRLASADSIDGLNKLLDRHARVVLSPSADGDLAGIGLP
jgi:hypothetical protein